MTVTAMKRLTALCLVVMLLVPACALAVNDGYNSVYTYTYDYWDDVKEMPDAYRVEQVLYSATLGLETAMKKPQSLYVRNNDVYVCDTGNNRILHLRREGGVFAVQRIITEIAGAEPATLKNPTDVFVAENGDIYICDKDNNRVLQADKALNFIRDFTKPADSTFDQNLSFLPDKLVVDTSGRVYVLATNVNKGLVKYEYDGTFTGFIGANPVTYTMWDYVWKTFLSTKEQRAQQASFVPTEYSNIAIDREGFIYATNTVFDEYDLVWDNAKPIRRLNAIGNDILVKNGWYPPIGDIHWKEQSVEYGPSKFRDITVLDNDIYVAFDRTRGRLFGYDPQGVLLWCFGTKGGVEGAFRAAVAIDHMGNDLLCLDENDCSVTVFTPTEYGSLIYQASDQYLRGDYDGSADTWREVLRFNANYNLAFIGIGRALMRQENYKEAMDYFKMAYDRDNYGDAYRYYRKELIEDNVIYLVIAIVALLVVPLIVRQVKKMKEEVEAYEQKKQHL